MIKTLIDEYAVAFPDQPYWHMGGDEYMMGDSYSNYSQFGAFVAANPDKFPAGSGPGDVFIWFMNQVNDYVKSKGKKLRIWNYGIPASSVVKLASDIRVEYWQKASSLSAQTVLNAGHDVQNASQVFYFSRPGAYGRNLTNLWNSGWTPQTMDGGAVVTDVPGKGKVLGAKLSAWPDDTPLATESQVEEQIAHSMRFLAQANWGGPKTTASYEAFSALSQTLGRAPNLQHLRSHPAR